MTDCNSCLYEEEDFSPIVRQMQKLQEQIDDINKRIKDIEFCIPPYDLYDQVASIAKELKELKETNNPTQDDMKAGRSPHKCPTCFGYGKIQVMQGSISPFEPYTIDYLGRYFKSCVTCQGKGVVWG